MSCETVQWINATLQEQAGKVEIKDASTFESLNLDSLDLFEFMLRVEERFGVEVEDLQREVDKRGAKTVGDYRKLIKEMAAAKA